MQAVIESKQKTAGIHLGNAKVLCLGYYDNFPPKYMGVSVINHDTSALDGRVIRKKILVADRDYKAKEVIYKVQVLSCGQTRFKIDT